MFSSLKNLSYTIILGLIGLTFTACGNLGSFSMTEESDEIVVPGQAMGLLGGLADLFPTTIPMEIDLDQQLQARDAGPAKSVFLTEIEFVITESKDPNGTNNFDFIDRVNIEIESRGSGSDLPRKRLAWNDSVQEGQRSFFLDIDGDVDLKPYIEEGLRLRSSANGSAPRNDVSFKVIAHFRVFLL
ncbi:MAG: hypothetical protein ACNA8W_20780 [Bradymonadaceae bacterium]